MNNPIAKLNLKISEDMKCPYCKSLNVKKLIGASGPTISEYPIKDAPLKWKCLCFNCDKEFMYTDKV